MSQRVSDEVVAEIIKARTPADISAMFIRSNDLTLCLALDLRDCRAELAQLRATMQILIDRHPWRYRSTDTDDPYGVTRAVALLAETEPKK